MFVVQNQVFPSGKDAVRRGYRDALVRPNNHLMEARTLIERRWRKIVNNGTALIPEGPSHNHGAKHIEKDGTIVFSPTPGNTDGCSFPMHEEVESSAMILKTEGLTLIDTTGERIFVGYHGSKGKTADLAKGYKTTARDPDNPFPSNHRLGLGIYCTFDRTLAGGFAGSGESVSEVWINQRPGEELKVHHQARRHIVADASGWEIEEFYEEVRNNPKGFLPEAERLEREYDVLSSPNFNFLFDDNFSEVRICIQNKINNHVLEEEGRVEFFIADL
jgi:hypothetical protein